MQSSFLKRVELGLQDRFEVFLGDLILRRYMNTRVEILWRPRLTVVDAFTFFIRVSRSKQVVIMVDLEVISKRIKTGLRNALLWL